MFALTIATLVVYAFAQSAKDAESIDAIIHSVYDVISGPAGKERDWERMRSLFVPDARLIAVGKRAGGEVVRRSMTVDEYIETSGPVLKERGFFEKEIARRTEHYGNISHAFSTYEARSKAEDEKPFMRGINSFQLYNDGKRWWVVTIYWQAEDASTPLPKKYLKDRPLPSE
ncbi:MAG: hypothetical protein ACR2HJ_10310 [Fimbriimonadales bacterium]